MTLQLAFGVTFSQLYEDAHLKTLDQLFLEELSASDAMLKESLVTARLQPDILNTKEQSELLLAVAPHLEDFIATLFGIQAEIGHHRHLHQELAVIFHCKRQFIQRIAAKRLTIEEALMENGRQLQQELETFFLEPLSEIAFAKHIMAWLEAESHYKTALDLAARYAAWALYSDLGKQQHQAGVLFKLPQKLHFAHLVDLIEETKEGVTRLKKEKCQIHPREGFALTDHGANLAYALDQTHYCILCHHQGKDSCSKGMKEKDLTFKKSPLDVTLTGCPLEEKISEMHTLKREGLSIAALAMICVDNPMVAATGHRICNDCMKACIYQKQEPVDIPQAETRILRDVLEFPWGVEIYSLLTRWNPLHLTRPYPKATSDYKILVVGLGPAGFTLSHHLLNEGYSVVAVEGLKIEPLPEQYSGITREGTRIAFSPVKHTEALFECLDDRIQAGFGGVAEYGITVRWNKNYLKLIRLMLERRQLFRMFGGVRFGSSLTYHNAFELGFDHIALACGAGKPTLLNIPNGLSRGVRTASDFLMALQLTGAAKKNSIANLQVRLPVVVIGGGLTALDTATEALAYYPVQVEKFLSRYEHLVTCYGESHVRSFWDEEERIIAEEFLSHARAIRQEQNQASLEQRDPDILKLLQQWGGVTVAYRRSFQESPSYRLNHEEVTSAMREGITFIEHAVPEAVLLDHYHHATSLKVTIKGQEISLPAKSIFIAAGTSPNTVLNREDPLHFQCHGLYFQAIDEEEHVVTPERVAKPSQVHVLMSMNEAQKAVSFFGDLHPSFVGNVVKAMGSAKQGYPVVSKIIKKAPPAGTLPAQKFLEQMHHLLTAKVHQVTRLTPSIIEIIVQAPLAAQAFQPGQFYRLQNYETLALKTQTTNHLETVLAMEGLALTGAWVDKERGLLSTIVLEMGGSADLCAMLEKGEPVVLMGPTGSPTHIASHETVLLIGGGLGNAVLFSIGKAFREAGSRVLYVAGYKQPQDRYKIEEIEQAADVIIWACDTELLSSRRPQDYSFKGNIVQALQAYAKGALGEVHLPLSAISRMIVIGSDRMMQAVASARQEQLKEYLNPHHLAIGSINSPMQCMMKEICAQCLQQHVDPATGEKSWIYSCYNQDQYLERVDFEHLSARLRQNTTQEKLTKQWIDHCLKQLGKRNAA